jgi:hypothetical protein
MANEEQRAHETREALLCPSADPSMDGAVLTGVVGGTSTSPRLRFLKETLPISDEILALTGNVAPGEVMRFAAPCAESACAHFAGGTCQLVSRIVHTVPPENYVLMPCPVRARCRWWAQEGKEACRRCLGIVSMSYDPSEELRLAATPDRQT